MCEWNDYHKKVFSKYARSIVHMRRQFQDGRLGLVFGAGASYSLNVPKWKELNKLVSEDTDVQGQQCYKEDDLEPIKTQRLYEHYKLKKLPKTTNTTPAEMIKQELRIYGEFRRILYKYLYANVIPKEKRIKNVHKYLKNYLTILRNTNLTVNYNFDDYIERFLREERTEEEKKSTIGYCSTTNINLPIRPDKRVIYHPNGFLPYEEMESGKSVVFSENEFANQLLGVMSGHYSSLVHHFCNNTCLLIGHSLNDPTLKHIFKLVMKMNPGRCHYYVCYYDEKGVEPNKDFKDAMYEANFETYNLITLFLCDKEIAALGDLIENGYHESYKKESGIKLLTNELKKNLTYCYYVVGAIGVGKSTTIAHFGDLVPYAEWLEPRDLDLGKVPNLGDMETTLSVGKIEKMDKWFIRQFTLKNHKIYEEDVGIIIIDRCPLDPVSFTPYNDWSNKAQLLLENILKVTPDIVKGHIILLIDDPIILEMRVIGGPKEEYTEKALKVLQDNIKNIYDIEQVSVLDARYMSSHEIIKRVAKIIHTEEYNEIDIKKRLEEIKNNGTNIQKQKVWT